MSRKLCVVQDFLTDEHKAMIVDAATAGDFDVEFYENYDEAKDYVADAEVLYCALPDIAGETRDAKWVATCWAGISPFLKPGVLPEGCRLTKGAGTYGVTISEYIICMSIYLMKRIPEYNELMVTDGWRPSLLKSRGIYGSKVTIVGTGDIGQNAAVRMRALGAAKITGVNYRGNNVSVKDTAVMENHTLTDIAFCNENGDLYDEIYRFTDIDEALPDTDVLVLCAPHTADTKYLMSAERIALLPEHAVLVNVGRGTIFDQDALIDALNNGRILGAALDVMNPEPLPLDHPLRTARNCVLTPHISGQMTMDHTMDQGVKLFCENLANYIEGRPLNNEVDRERGY